MDRFARRVSSDPVAAVYSGPATWAHPHPAQSCGPPDPPWPRLATATGPECWLKTATRAP
eukprot:2500831-Prymnesium_polylepis.2